MSTAKALGVLVAYYRRHFVPPFMVAPRKGKHYGTHVLDSDGVEVAEFWTADGEPSVREKAHFGSDWTPEAWAEYICDSHWESQADLDAAEALVALLNDPDIDTP